MSTPLNLEEFEPPIDYRSVLLHLIEKIQRTGSYYRKQAQEVRRRAEKAKAEGKFEYAQATFDRAESLANCANDMKFIFDKATMRILPADVAEMWAIQDADKSESAGARAA